MPYRYFIVGITALAALWMYIDRVCFSTLAAPMKAELLLPHAPAPGPDDKLTDPEINAAKNAKAKREKKPVEQVELAPEDLDAAKRKKWADSRMSFALSAFFLTYALFQIPMGTLADRYGTRTVLAISIAAWSLVTMATGFVLGFAALLVIRLLLGITESGAYPAAAGLVKNWAEPDERGRFSSVVAFGGRVGGAIAPWLTTTIAALLVGVAVVEWAVTPTPVPPDADGKSPPNWRGVFFVYGFAGLVVALAFWLFVRDHPPGVVPAKKSGGSIGAIFQNVFRLAKSTNMWFFGGVQFGVNLGWAFVVTLLPIYLSESFGTPLEEVGPMQSTALTIGFLGMLPGGFLTDFTRRKFGLRLGRSVPIAVAMLGCAASYFAITLLPTAWAVIFALGVMAFLVDLHNPSIWSFAQDVGGKNVGAALGWGNMWGNLGAALSPVLMNVVKDDFGWNAVFIVGGCAFLTSAACGMMLNAAKPVEPEPTAEAAG
jgi:ACS family glucarate transporter-like MFS transporter